MSKKRIVKRIAIVLAILIVLLGGATVVYVNDYYHADESVQSFISETNAETLVFRPSAENDQKTGLIFYPGGKVEYTAYAPLMSRLAEQGITCILVHMPCNLAIMDIDRAAQIPEQYPEMEHWYIGGHSLGGAAASMYLEKDDTGIEGLILLGAYSSADLSSSDLRVLSVFGSEDGVMNRENYEKDRKNLPVQFSEQIIEGGCHAYFGSYGEQDGDGQAKISREEQQDLTAEIISEWILNQ